MEPLEAKSRQDQPPHRSGPAATSSASRVAPKSAAPPPFSSRSTPPAAPLHRDPSCCVERDEGEDPPRSSARVDFRSAVRLDPSGSGHARRPRPQCVARAGASPAKPSRARQVLQAARATRCSGPACPLPWPASPSTAPSGPPPQNWPSDRSRPARHQICLGPPNNSDTSRSVRIRSTTLVRLLHGFVLQSGIPGPKKTCTEQRGCPEKSPKKKGLHPAARDKPGTAGPARTRTSTCQAAARRIRESGETAWGVSSSQVHGADGLRRGGVRDRVRPLGGRAEAAHGGAAERAAAGAGHVGAGAADDGGDRLANYDHLFRIKGAAARSDVFCVMSGLWRSPAERFFLWIGGFRPSEVLKILSPQLQPMTEPQSVAVYGLQLSSAQAEDALSQGMQKLQQTLADSLTDPFASPDAYMVGAVEKLKGLVDFVQQADHLRLETLQNMHRILTTRQAAKGLLVLGDYFQRLRALSTLWAQRPREAKL